MPISISMRLMAVFFVLALMLAGCGNSQQSGQGGPPPPSVTVAKPVKRSVVDQDEYVGRFIAVDSVEIRSRVSGYLDTIHFKDGQFVKKGDLLFTIDRRPFRIALEQARANLQQAQANLAFTEADLARGQQLVRDKTITEQTFDQRTQAKHVAEASVAANQAIVDQAELDYSQYSELRAPVDGRIGDRRVSPGNLVTGGAGGNTTLLATVMSTDPIWFEFTFDEASYLRYQRIAGGGKQLASHDMSWPVKLKLIDEAGFTHDGNIDFIDNAISQNSGTIRARATLANPNELFTPGMFGRIQVPGSAPYEALQVPDVAIGTEQDRKYVLVVDAENTVRQKYVELAQLVDDLRVIKQGVTTDDRVIVNGLMRARVGNKVTPEENPSKAPGTPTAKTN